MSAESVENAEPRVSIRTSGLDAAEIAAVTAVLTAVTSAEHEPEPVAPVPTAWNRSQRGVRGELRPGPDAWRSFSG